MDKISDNLSEKSAWYRNWHSTDKYKTAHWLIFIVVVVLTTVFLLTQISNWMNIVADLNLIIHLPKASAVLTLDPPTKTVEVGEIFATNIILDTANGPIDGVDIYALHYDPTILNVIDDLPNQSGTQIKPGTIISSTAANIVDESTGTIKFGQAAAGGTSFSGKGILATIHFKAIRAGSSYLKFDFNPGSTVDTNAAHKGKDQLSRVVDAIYTVTPK